VTPRLRLSDFFVEHVCSEIASKLRIWMGELYFGSW